MSLVAKAGSNFKKEQRDLPKAGMRTAVLTGIIDVGMQKQSYMGEAKQDRREFLPIFHLTSDMYTDHEGNERCHVLSPFPMKISPGADKGKYIEFCEAIDPSHAVMEKGAGDLSQLLGRAILVKVVHSAPQGEEKIVYANIKGVGELPEGMPFKEYEGEHLLFDCDTPDADAYKKMWPSTRNTIKKSVGYEGSELEAFCVKVDAELNAGKAEEDDDEAPF